MSKPLNLITLTIDSNISCITVANIGSNKLNFKETRFDSLSENIFSSILRFVILNAFQILSDLCWICFVSGLDLCRICVGFVSGLDQFWVGPVLDLCRGSDLCGI